MDWSGVLKRYGWESQVSGNDPFHPLALAAQQHSAKGGSIARVNTSLGTSHDYGAVKVGFSVTIDCAQDDASITMAGEVTFLKAMELLNSATDYLQIPAVNAHEHKRYPQS